MKRALAFLLVLAFCGSASGQTITPPASGSGGGSGTVTSVAVSGGTTGLTTSGGPITTSGTIALAGTLAAANGGTGVTALGTGVATALGQNVSGSGGFCLTTSCSLTTPALGTPSSGTLTNATGLPILTGISGLGTGVATALGSAVNGSGAVVLTTSPALVTPALGAATATTINSVTIPTGADTVDLLGTAQTISAAKTFSATGAASTPGLTVSGARFAGTGTTSFPQLYVQESTATPSSTLSTSGTLIGGNMHTNAGNLMSLMTDGVEKFSVTSAGTINVAGNMVGGANITASIGSVMNWNSRSSMSAPGDGRWRVTNNAASQGFGLDFTGAPTVGGTATPTLTTGSTDAAGEVTAGTSATSVTITFALAKTNAPFCTVTSQTQLAAFAYTVSTTVITITQTATTGNKINYVCFTRPN